MSFNNFEVIEDSFFLNGKPFRILSGALHYFRVLPQQWEDRLLKLKAMGLNTVETYVAWNVHEAERGCFRFDGAADLVGFIRLAQALGLYVIVRPGPFICAEWEFGGLPAWLLNDPEMEVRCCYPPYQDAVQTFFSKLLPMLVPLQIQHGGPILAMQVENEYGSYGSDQSYLQWLNQLMLELGVQCLLFTSDGATRSMLTHGSLPSVLKTANFGSRAAEEFATLRQYQPRGPLMCMEFWNGWFDHWGEVHHTRHADDAANALEQIMASGASVNVYMFHGGSNFGFMNGANTDLISREYQPTINSYDYDAPLNEAGEPTPKFHAFRRVLERHNELPETALPPPTTKYHSEALRFKQSVSLLDSLSVLSTPELSIAPRSMESLGQNYGFLLYCSEVCHPQGKATLSVERVHDRAQVFVNGREVGVLARNGPLAIEIELPETTNTIELLVENQGRVNYGPDLQDRKGILGWVRLDLNKIYHWSMFTLPLNNLSNLAFVDRSDGENLESQFKLCPAFHRTTFNVDQPGDCFLALTRCTKGVAWLNGFNLGRYWDKGPQTALYVPAPLLQPGQNELIILELHQSEVGSAQFVPHRPL